MSSDHKTVTLLLFFSFFSNFKTKSVSTGDLTCVRPPVSLQLIAPGESLPTEHPVADEGSLAAVPAQVSSEVGCLPVNLAAAGDVADVLLLLPHT